MTEVVEIQSSNPSSIQNSPTTNDELYQQQNLLRNKVSNNNNNNNSALCAVTCIQSNNYTEEDEVGGGERKRRRQQEEEEEEREYYYQLNNFVGLFVTAVRRSVFGCSTCEINNNSNSNSNSAAVQGGGGVMEIGIPTNVRHVAHVTFDRFNGFLGLPVEFEPDVPRRPPSASATVFGVSTNSMQLSFDTRGNSVPTILLMMQHRLYALGGLQAEGIFRINPDNGQEESVRDQLNRGLLPEDVDVHSLAGLIKAWFRELPSGVLDCLSPEQVMQSQTEQESTELARLLPPTEFALLDWAINLMADVAQFEHLNKMNARNIAMVFAPNMTHMTDPLTALMHAVQVMNLLKTLIEKALREREDSIIDTALDSYYQDSPGGNGNHVSLQTILEEASEPDGEEEHNSTPVNKDSLVESIGRGEEQSLPGNCKDGEPKNKNNFSARFGGVNSCNQKGGKYGQSCTIKKGKERPLVKGVNKSGEKAKGSSLVSSINLRSEGIETWR